MRTPYSIHEHDKRFHDLEYQEEIGKDDQAIDEKDDIDCSAKGMF